MHERSTPSPSSSMIHCEFDRENTVSVLQIEALLKPTPYVQTDFDPALDG